MNEQGLLRREKQRQRLRKLANLEMTEAQIQLANEDIKKLESVVEEGIDSYIRLR